MSRIRMKQIEGIGRVSLDYAIDQFLVNCKLKNLTISAFETYKNALLLLDVTCNTSFFIPF